MSDHDRWDPPESDEETPELTPGLAISLTVAASFLSLVLAASFSSATPGFVSPALLGLGMLLGYGTAFVLARRFVADPPGPALGFVWAPRRAWLAAVLFLPSVLLISELENVIASVVPRPAPPERDALPLPTGVGWVGQLIVAGVLVQPLVQEVFFRGFLQPRVEPHWGSRGAVLGTALLGVLAAAPFQIPALSTLALPLGYGLLQGVLRRAGGSIYPCLALGMGLGAVGVLAQFELFGIPGFDAVEAGAHTPLQVLFPPALCLGIGLALCRLPRDPDPTARSESDPVDSPER